MTVIERDQIETALKIQAEQFSTLIANIPGAVYRSTCELRLTVDFISDFIEEISGYPATSFVQESRRSLDSIIHPDDRSSVQQVIRSSLLQQCPYRVEYRICCADGSQRWVDEKGQGVFTANGELQWLDGVIFDITEHKRTEAAVRQAEAKYRSIFENSINGIFQTTADGHYLSANPALARIYGYDSCEELIAGLTDIAHQLYVKPGRREEFARIMQRCGVVSDFESEIYRKDGSIIWIAENARAVRDSEGNLLYYEGTVEDITVWKRAEQMRESAELLQLILDNIPQAIFWKDCNSVYLGCNQVFAERAGLSTPADVIGKTAYDFPRFSLEEAAALHIWDQRVMRQDQAELHVLECITSPTGRQTWVDRNKIPIHNAEGQVIGVLGTVEDVTDRKLAEACLRESEAKSREAAEIAQAQSQQLEQMLQTLQKTQSQLVQNEKMSSLGQLVAGVAHEINNPVNFIYGNLTYAERYLQELLSLIQLYHTCYPDPLPEIQAKNEEIDLEFLLEDLPAVLSSMKMGADRIRQIVLSLRNFSRLDEAAMKAADIHEGLDSTLLILQNRFKPNSSNPGIQVIKEYGELPLIECYAGQLNQVFMNILSNAIDALENQPTPRTITIRTEVMEVRESGEADSSLTPAIVIRIQDNGPGMTEEVRSKLFDPFFTTKPVGKGTGLGLSISYQIVVEKHQGILQCFSEPGQGSEFWIQIPYQITG